MALLGWGDTEVGLYGGLPGIKRPFPWGRIFLSPLTTLGGGLKEAGMGAFIPGMPYQEGS